MIAKGSFCIWLLYVAIQAFLDLGRRIGHLKVIARNFLMED